MARIPVRSMVDALQIVPFDGEVAVLYRDTEIDRVRRFDDRFGIIVVDFTIRTNPAMPFRMAKEVRDDLDMAIRVNPEFWLRFTRVLPPWGYENDALWRAIYPFFLDGETTIHFNQTADGRISAHRVCDNPRCLEIGPDFYGRPDGSN